MTYVIKRTPPNVLAHHGISGQKWGVRRYENEDGTLTEAGKKRYSKSEKIASREKISKEQIKKNAFKRGAAGAVIGSSVAQLADRFVTKRQYGNATTNKIVGFDAKSASDSDLSEKLRDVRFEDFHTFPIGQRRNQFGQMETTRLGMFVPEFVSNGKAISFGKTMAKNLLVSPASGALIGAGAGALGSLAVDSIHNARIDRAKKFIDRYREAYEKTNREG